MTLCEHDANTYASRTTRKNTWAGTYFTSLIWNAVIINSTTTSILEFCFEFHKLNDYKFSLESRSQYKK